MQNEDLKTCPFCGCDVELKRFTYPNGEKLWRVNGWHDDGCMYEVSFDIPEGTNKRNLIRAWNRRKGGCYSHEY